MTINDTILNLLLSGEKLHRYDCRFIAGTESLHSIISYLQKRYRLPIERKKVTRLDANGTPKRIKLYWVDPEYLQERNKKKTPE